MLDRLFSQKYDEYMKKSGEIKMNTTCHVAVLADIHSNHYALEACVTYALEKGIHDFIFLG